MLCNANKHLVCSSMLSDVRAKQDIFQQALQSCKYRTDVRQHRRLQAAGEAPAQKVNANANPWPTQHAIFSPHAMWAASAKKSAPSEPIVFEGPGWSDAMCTQSGFGERARKNHLWSHSGFTTHTDTRWRPYGLLDTIITFNFEAFSLLFLCFGVSSKLLQSAFSITRFFMLKRKRLF